MTRSKSAFRKLAWKYHPDVPSRKDKIRREIHGGSISLASSKRSEKRKKYDQLGANWNQPEDFNRRQGGVAGTSGRRISPIMVVAMAALNSNSAGPAPAIFLKHSSEAGAGNLHLAAAAVLVVGQQA